MLEIDPIQGLGQGLEAGEWQESVRRLFAFSREHVLSTRVQLLPWRVVFSSI